jgi:hypothetical protein
LSPGSTLLYISSIQPNYKQETVAYLPKALKLCFKHAGARLWAQIECMARAAFQGYVLGYAMAVCWGRRKKAASQRHINSRQMLHAEHSG